MVADAYGIPSEQYARVISAFSHRNYPRAPELCGVRFDRLKAIGIEIFKKKLRSLLGYSAERELAKPVTELPPSNEEVKVFQNKDLLYILDRSGQESFLPPDNGLRAG